MLFEREHLVHLEPGRGVANFPASWALFRGHFPGDPVVPAYVLIGFARVCAEEALGRAVEIAAIERVKLTRRLGPGQAVTCTVAVEGDRVRAHLSTPEGEVGTIALRVGA